jgi:hypothetical protein
VPCSFDEAEPIHPIIGWIVPEEEWEEVKSRLTAGEADKIKIITDFLQTLEDDILNSVRSIHDVDKSGSHQNAPR